MTSTCGEGGGGLQCGEYSSCTQESTASCVYNNIDRLATEEVWKLTSSSTHKAATKNSIVTKIVMRFTVNGIYKIRIIWVQNFSGHCKAC